MSDVELLSPAGDFETALAAFDAGADAVYCGLNDFSARAFAKNLSEAELASLIACARKRGKKVYITFNTLVDESRLDDAIRTLATLDDLKVDAIIVQDLGIAEICRKHFPALSLHASTQMVAHNLEGVLALKDLGFKRVVLARELSLEEIASIVKRCGETEIECFIHGALCYSISGLCLFGAMEKGRSGNRGTCPYCCRQRLDGKYPFSMRDLRLGEAAKRLADAGVKSLKIEGRMKSPLYVASVTKHYRAILDGGVGPSLADLETVFSRRTTSLYLEGPVNDAVIDDESLGHVGAEIGAVKKVTKDREGLSWLRFHTARALEKHDGLQFEAMAEDRHLGLGIGEMRQAISRRPVFEVAAGEDVEVLVSEEIASALKPKMKIYCSMSNAVKRAFPQPSFRPSDYAGANAVALEITLKGDGASAKTTKPFELSVSRTSTLEKAKNPEKTAENAEKAFSKLGGTAYHLEKIAVKDDEKLFVPASLLNDLRRELVEKLDAAREENREAKIREASEGGEIADETLAPSLRTIKLRADQKLPAGEWSEVIRVMDGNGDRVATPVWTSELEFNRLRTAVKKLLREGCEKWEASDLATLRMLKALGVKDITADWTLYAFNSRSLGLLKSLGVRRFTASPENDMENLHFLAESGYAVEFLAQQSTPLFISLTKPKEQGAYAVVERNGLWITTAKNPRTFELPKGVSTRIDLSWDI